MFKQRSMQPEIMDGANFGVAEAEASYRFIRRINRYFGGAAVVHKFVRRQLAIRNPRAPALHILDVGCGCADIAILVSKWCHRHGHSVRFTCLERDPQALAIARAAADAAGLTSLTIVAADAFAHRPAEPYDCAVASMLLHHLDSTMAEALLAHLASIVTGPVLINDLRRCLGAWLGAGLLTLGQPWPVRHDAQLSVRRGFRRRELQQWLSQTFPAARIRVTAAWPYRLAAELAWPRHTRAQCLPDLGASQATTAGAPPDQLGCGHDCACPESRANLSPGGAIGSAVFGHATRRKML